MTTIIKINGSEMKVRGSYSQVKKGFIAKGAKFQESRTKDNAEDIFINSKLVGTILK